METGRRTSHGMVTRGGFRPRAWAVIALLMLRAFAMTPDIVSAAGAGSPVTPIPPPRTGDPRSSVVPTATVAPTATRVAPPAPAAGLTATPTKQPTPSPTSTPMPTRRAPPTAAATATVAAATRGPVPTIDPERSTAPTIGKISPNTGTTGGGTAVTISGTNFAAGARVSFDGVPATDVTVESDILLTAT